MAVQGFPYLVMTDGTLTATFADGLGGLTSYAPVRGTWAVAITTRRRAALGRGPWNEVIEEWELNIRGADAATALSNLETLVRLLDNADRFWRLGENVSPVLLKYTPQGSTLFTTANPSQALVIGRAPGDETNLTLPAIFNDVGMYYEIRGVRLRFLRTGQWLNPTAETASSSVAAIPTVQSATLASTLTISSPTKLTYDFTVAGVPTYIDSSSPSFVLTANSTSRLQIYEGEAASFAAPWATQADAAARARGGSVIRYSPGALSATLFWAFASFDANARRVAVWAAVRNNSTTTVFTLRPALWSSAGIPQSIGPLTTIDASIQTPRIVFLGIMSAQQAVYGLEFDATASAASGTLDIDYLVVHAVDDETSTTVALYSQVATVYAVPVLTPGYTPAVLDPRALSAPTPLATAGTSPIVVSPYNGDAYIMTKGATVAAVWLGVANPAVSGSFWRPSTVGSVGSAAITVARSNGYLSPR